MNGQKFALPGLSHGLGMLQNFLGGCAQSNREGREQMKRNAMNMFQKFTEEFTKNCSKSKEEERKEEKM
jgi:hypothetical protein